MSTGATSYLVPWDEMAIVGHTELQRWDVLLVAVRDASCMPEKVRAENAAMFGPGAQLALMPMQFGTDLALLSHALQRYIRQPECWPELARLAQLDA